MVRCDIVDSHTKDVIRIFKKPSSIDTIVYSFMRKDRTQIRGSSVQQPEVRTSLATERLTGFSFLYQDMYKRDGILIVVVLI